LQTFSSAVKRPFCRKIRGARTPFLDSRFQRKSCRADDLAGPFLRSGTFSGTMAIIQICTPPVAELSTWAGSSVGRVSTRPAFPKPPTTTIFSNRNGKTALGRSFSFWDGHCATGMKLLARTRVAPRRREVGHVARNACGAGRRKTPGVSPVAVSSSCS
jgi:hypothetical protein